MSLLLLPDELIEELLKHIFRAPKEMSRPLVPLSVIAQPEIVNTHRDIESLSLITRRVRRICLPILFSHVVVVENGKDECKRFTRVCNLVAKRCHIAELIRLAHIDFRLMTVLTPYGT
jgi:hypothetical protein